MLPLNASNSSGRRGLSAPLVASLALLLCPSSVRADEQDPPLVTTAGEQSPATAPNSPNLRGPTQVEHAPTAMDPQWMATAYGLPRARAVPAAAVPQGGARANTARPGAGCGLDTADRQTATVDSCSACHQSDGHPVGMHYASVAQEGNPAALRPLSQLVPQIVLDSEGRISCTTCHDGASTRPHKTALDSRKMLCLACHDFGSSEQDYAAFPPGEDPKAEVAAEVQTPLPSRTLLGQALTQR
jgi:predicted CXXCH cytochrome family protein